MRRREKKHQGVAAHETEKRVFKKGSSRSIAWLCLCLALVTAGAYLAAARNGYVNYDDPEYVVTNPHVQRGLSVESLVWAFKTGHADNWHPVTWISHLLDWTLFQGDAGRAHMVNVAVHVANAVVLFVLLRSLTGLVWRSWFVAAFFALHPLHVESVAWIAERKDVLSTLFFLLTAGAYTVYARAGGRQRWTAYGLALGLFALGLMSKPMAVTAPFVLLLLDYWPLGRLAPGQGGRVGSALGRLLIEKTPFFVLSACSSVVTYLVQQRGGAVSVSVALPDRLTNALVSYAVYLKKTVWPFDLAVFYPHPGKWPWVVVLAAVFVLAVVSVFVFWGAKKRYLTVGWLWFLGRLVPVIGLVQVGMQAMADRYT